MTLDTDGAFCRYYRMPSYVMAKFALGIASGLYVATSKSWRYMLTVMHSFIGFSFYNADNSQQGMQNVLYSLFMVSSIFSTIVQQIMPLFVVRLGCMPIRFRQEADSR